MRQRSFLTEGKFLSVAGVIGIVAALFPVLAVGQEAPGTAPTAADPAPTILPAPVLTLDQKRLFADSAFGKAVVAQAEADAAKLAEENRRLETELESEERSLTERRARMSPAEFAPIAAAFDKKVEEIRAAQDAKARDITRILDDERRRFFQAMVPVLGGILRDTGAAAILVDSAVVLSLSSLDITDLAIERMDLQLPAPLPGAVPPPGTGVQP